MGRHSGSSSFHDGAPSHRTRKQRKARGKKKQSKKDKGEQKT